MTEQCTLEEFTREQVAKRLLGLILAAAERDKVAAIATCDAALDILAPSWPEIAPMAGASRDEALWWAECASDTMRAEMLVACLRHCESIPMNTGRAKKRALVAIWNTLNEQDRTAFLEHVDPGPGAKA